MSPEMRTPFLVPEPEMTEFENKPGGEDDIQRPRHKSFADIGRNAFTLKYMGVAIDDGGLGVHDRLVLL
jgi:hypothetical protein